ncbi:hypothetical protein ACB094_04G072300 [Castanea mollissima]
MRRASTLASSVLSRTLATAHGGVGVGIGVATSIAVHHNQRLLQVALYGSSSSSGGSYTRWWSKSPARVLSLGVAGALISVAAAQEVHAKEPPPPELVPKDVVLYQYEACPFCNKVKAFLDYYDIPYKVVEVNPISKKEIKWSDYQKVPILMVDGEQLIDSSVIIDKLGGKIHSDKRANSKSDNDEEKKWRGWVDNHLVHILSPNIYRNTSEALESFDYITSNDERAALYEAAETWVDGLNGRDFLGGSKPNLADLAVYGVLRPIRYLRSGKDMVEHTRIGDWYTRMESAVGESSRIKA